ncbi:uncharacterized protein LOC107038063 [Diachasma alloeum]|uniref:uncharacterized protein LOC107038063 n=1 Tax=Diachasma alloeum TaxID=454923 RepID=UPI0007383141|nr:uncharacterized protein LOC107038063 [Diachasma alloeum]
MKMLIQVMLIFLTMLGTSDCRLLTRNESLVVTGVKFGRDHGDLYIMLEKRELLADGLIGMNKSIRHLKLLTRNPHDIDEVNVDDFVAEPGSFIADIHLKNSERCPGVLQLTLVVGFCKLNKTLRKLDVLEIQPFSEYRWNNWNPIYRVGNLAEQNIECICYSSKDFITFRKFDANGLIANAPLLFFSEQFLESVPPAPLTVISLTYKALPTAGGLLSLENHPLLNSSHQKIIYNRMKRYVSYSSSSTSWDDIITDHPEYIYIPVLVVLAIIIFLICWFFKCITDCICDCFCGRRRNVIVNNVSLLTPDYGSRHNLPQV